MIEWINKPENQSELAKIVMYWIDTGNFPGNIISDIYREHGDKYSEQEIKDTIDNLKRKLLVVSEDDGYLHVTDCSHDSIVEATGSEDFIDALKKLKELKIFHPDMVRYGVISKEDALR